MQDSTRKCNREDNRIWVPDDESRLDRGDRMWRFCAAGTFPLRCVRDPAGTDAKHKHWIVLLCVEEREGGVVLHPLGGKRDKRTPCAYAEETKEIRTREPTLESMAETAAREMREETRLDLSLSFLEPQLQSCPVFWRARGQYALHLWVWTDEDDKNENAQRLLHATRTSSALSTCSPQDLRCKTQALAWIHLGDLMNRKPRIRQWMESETHGEFVETKWPASSLVYEVVCDPLFAAFALGLTWGRSAKQ